MTTIFEKTYSAKRAAVAAARNQGMVDGSYTVSENEGGRWIIRAIEDEVPARDVNADLVGVPSAEEFKAQLAAEDASEATKIVNDTAEVEPAPALTSPGLARLRASKDAEAIRAGVLKDQAAAKASESKRHTKVDARFADPADVKARDAELVKLAAESQLIPKHADPAPAEGIRSKDVLPFNAERREKLAKLNQLADQAAPVSDADAYRKAKKAGKGLVTADGIKSARGESSKAKSGRSVGRACPPENTKGRTVFDLLRRPEGVTSKEMATAGAPGGVRGYAEAFAKTYGFVAELKDENGVLRGWLRDLPAEKASDGQAA